MKCVRLPLVLALPAAFAAAVLLPAAAPAPTSPLPRDPAGSPVHWLAWDAALPARAKQENKPVYVFLGSSLSELSRATCRQTFTNADTAAFLNANFLCVFVDKDEQPELAAAAQYYLRNVKQMEGWPAHLWLTPELQPFEGANYLPPTEEWGKASFMKIAQQAQSAWAGDAAGVRSHAADTVARLAAAVPAVKAGPVTPEKLSAAATAWRARYDAAHGGFADTPKNPEPELLRFLLKQSPADRDAALATLRAIAGSALRDPLDGGFFRYASDAAWHLPYQQKTLADQARLAFAFLDGAKTSAPDAPAFAAAARGALDYALKRLAHPDGTFAGAEDATDDEHAGYYAWTEAEIDAALGTEAAAFKQAHGIVTAGNISADDDPSGRFQGKNLLRSALPADAKDAAAAARLLAARDKRPAIVRDERATSGAHGLLLAALARAGAQLNEPRYFDAAARLLAAVKKAYLAKDGGLRRLAGASAAGTPADYTAFALGCREYARAAHKPDADALATQLLARAGRLYFDATSGHYFAAPTELPAGVFVRPPAPGEPPRAEVLAILADAPSEQTRALTAALGSQLDDADAPPAGDILLSLTP
jgi:uncharacterized protein YyaL (SSP411 family)